MEIRRSFDHWLENAMHRLELAREAMDRSYVREAAFDLHQSVEGLYRCILHVLTHYSPKIHRLTFLRIHAEQVAPPLITVWRDDTPFAKRCFARLDQAYIGARYSHDYEIIGEELAWLITRVSILQDAVIATCLKHLDDFDRTETWDAEANRDHPISVAIPRQAAQT